MVGDAFDGFSGLAASLLEEIRDEYSEASIVSFINSSPALNAASLDKSTREHSNMALTLASLLETSSLTIPLAPSNLVRASNGRQTIEVSPEVQRLRYVRT